VIIDEDDVNSDPDEVILSALTPVNLITGYKSGSHSIVPAAMLSENFEIRYDLAKLLINKALLELKADNNFIYYGDALPTFTFKINGLKYDDDFSDVFSGTVTFKITNSSGVVVTTSPLPAGVYNVVPVVQIKQPIDYTVTLSAGTLYVNPKGPGAKKLKPKLDCVEQLPSNHPSGFKYVAHFACDNDNPTTVFVPIGDDNLLIAQGSKSGVQPEVFPPGTTKFDIYFDGKKLIWTVRTFDINQKTSVGTEASSSSARCPSGYVSSSSVVSTPEEIMVNEHDLSVYPNPVSNELYIEFRNMNIFEKDIRMYDLLGRVVQVTISKISSHAAKVYTGGLTPGMYLIRILDAKETKTIKILKK
jgi:hypothetical protein